MTPEQTHLVQRSFEQAQPQAEAVATLFYDRLFHLDPALRPLFQGDIAEQRRKLMAMLHIAVHDLDRIEEILPALRELGRRHAEYGVRDSHYDTVGEALLWTLRQTLNAEFIPEVESAWRAVYHLLATTMQAGASSSPAGSETHSNNSQRKGD
jgi:hemoglobin-like flavoprotein